MRTYKFILLFQAFFICFFSAPPTAKSAALDFQKLKFLSDEQLFKNVKIESCSENDLDALLGELQRRFPEYLKRIKAVAALYKGAPYCTTPLKDETANWFPYQKTDCTLFVLYSTAFANSSNYQEALTHMRHLHYRGAKVGFKTRYHFTADRITDPDNKYFSVITRQYVKNPDDLKQLTLNLNRKHDGASYFNGRLDNWSRKVTISYIPRAGFHLGMLRSLPEVIGIAFVKQSNWEKGVVVGHEGLLVEGDLYHSSPDSGIDVIKNFLRADFPHSQWQGIILYKINEVSGRAARGFIQR